MDHLRYLRHSNSTLCSIQLLENKRSLLNAGAKDLHCYIMIWQGACADVVCKIGKSQCRKPPFESNSSAHKLFCTTTFNVPLQLLQIGSSQKNKRVKARKTRAPHTKPRWLQSWCCCATPRDLSFDGAGGRYRPSRPMECWHVCIDICC